MKYGVTHFDGDKNVTVAEFDTESAAGKALQSFANARGALLDGETLTLYSVASDGVRVTLQRARNVVFVSLGTLH